MGRSGGRKRKEEKKEEEMVGPGFGPIGFLGFYFILNFTFSIQIPGLVIPIQMSL